MRIPLHQVDAFSNRPFAGNPAAVCFLDQPMSDAWMQAVAEENNLAETAFIEPLTDGFRLRWFTPVTEVDLCGHATLASAHVLWETGRLRHDEPARFHSLSGLLTCTYRDGWIEMDFPAEPVAASAVPGGLFESLGIVSGFVGKNRMDYLVALDADEEVRRLSPDFAGLGKIDARGIIVTARSSTQPYDFISRFFAPRLGVNEDHVCGSAHCALGPFWQARLDKNRLLAYQASRRGGIVRVGVEQNRVRLGGQAVTVVEGALINARLE
ncbi:MAG: PhzF family phenazine biosynthesis protein [Planctomycetota bacterium]